MAQNYKWVLADAFAIAELYRQDGIQVSVQEIWNEMQAEIASMLLNQGGQTE